MTDHEPIGIQKIESKISNVTQEYNKFIIKISSLYNDQSVSVDEHTTSSGKTVKKYNLTGSDFAFLSHVVGLGIKGDHFETSQTISEDISHWDSVEKGKANNYISCSLITDSHVAYFTNGSTKAPVLLGFDHVDDGDLIMAKCFDYGTRIKGNLIASSDEIDYPHDILKTSDHGGKYNEVVIARYGQDEQTRKPDFIIVFDGKISKRVEQAIDYFGIPIVNFKTSAYIDKINQQLDQIIDFVGQSASLEEKKQIFSKIPELYTNKNLWQKYGSNDIRPCNEDIKQKILSLEKDIIIQQLKYNEDLIGSVKDSFINQPNIENLNKLHQVMYNLACESHLSKEAAIWYYIFIDNIYGGEYMNLTRTWINSTENSLVETFIESAPVVVNLYQQQLDKIRANIHTLSPEQLQQELELFNNYSLIKKAPDGKLVLKNPETSYEGLFLVEDPTVSKMEKEDYEKLLNSLTQVWTAQNRFYNAIKFEQYNSERLQQQNDLLGSAGSNIPDLIKLLNSQASYYDSDFRKRIQDNIKKYLINSGRKKMDIISDFRANYDQLNGVYLYEKLINSFCDSSDKGIFRILSNPNNIGEMPVIINTSDPILVSGEKSKFVTFTGQNGKCDIFLVTESDTYGLQKYTDSSVTKTVDDLNKKWFWRLIRQIPKFDPSSVYQVDPYLFSDVDLLLVRSNDRWYTINGLSVQKVKMENFDIETGQTLL